MCSYKYTVLDAMQQGFTCACPCLSVAVVVLFGLAFGCTKIFNLEFFLNSVIVGLGLVDKLMQNIE